MGRVRRVERLAAIGGVVVAMLVWTPDQAIGLSVEIREVLVTRMALLESEIARDPIVVEAVRTSNLQHQDLTLQEIQALDQEWVNASEPTAIIKALLANASAERLVSFQDAHPDYREIFVTDERGLNVGMTNQTSDYYQADEEWWVQTFDQGRGKMYYGDIEYDESAMMEAIPVYVPVLDPNTHQAIGVIKAVIDITAIKLEL